MTKQNSSDRARKSSKKSVLQAGLALVSLLTVPGVAAAQQAPAPPADAAEAEDAVVVVGTRASQRSAIERERNARTPTDSIVAEDVGSFPDRNVNEAISRIPGVALGRNDYGEGESVAIRGNGPNLTRVELDGIGVQSTNSLAISAGGGRNADLRELPADLIKSVDIVKGTTADMTEGSLGGSVIIETRTGLDFESPYISLRLGGQQNTLSEEWAPDGNFVAAGQFLDGRLGVIASATINNIQVNGHTIENTTSNGRGYARLFDFDGSPEKTFALNPDTVGTDAADVLLANSIYTPRQLVTRAASAQSQSECFTLFPHNPAGTGAQRQARILEQQTCLNQWHEYTPSLIRNFQNSQEDERTSYDIRFDYRIADTLTVYAKYNENNRLVNDQNRSRQNVGGIQQNAAGTSLVSTTGYPRTRSVAAAAPAGYYLWSPLYGLDDAGNATAAGATNADTAVLGNVLNVVPGSVVIDSDHSVTQMTLTNQSVNIDQISNVTDIQTSYMQFGGDYERDRVEINFMAGRTDTVSSRTDLRTARGYQYGNATITLQPNGHWDVDLPATYDDTNPANFVQLRAPVCVNGVGTPPTCTGQAAAAATINNPATPLYTVGQMPLTTPNFSVSYSPFLAESSEEIARLDFTYSTDGLIPFISRIKTGLMHRERLIDRWAGGGYEARAAVGTFGQPGYVPPIVVPTANVRGSYRACEPTSTSALPGGLSCNYGFVPSTNLLNIRQGVDTLTPTALRDLLAATLEPNTGTFFNGYPDRNPETTSWQGIDVNALFAAFGASQFMNYDCVKQCMASDGRMYDQPVTTINEIVDNVYFMVDFEQELPLGLRFDGNVGIRGVYTDASGVGNMTLNAIRITPAYNPLNPTAAGGFVTNTFRSNVELDSQSTDWLGSYNFNLWGFDDQVVLRYYGGNTVARPGVTNMLPAGTCNIDQRNEPGVDPDDTDTNTCTGRVGNPNLEPYTAVNSSWNIEWYPNDDTNVSLAYHSLDVEVGEPLSVTKTAALFAGSDVIDPVTGLPLSSFEFSYPTFDNGPGYTRTGWEFSVRTAFTQLPWLLQYTGADFNISTLESSGTNVRDPNTGDVMSPPGESQYYTNLSLWYDDGKLAVRLAYQNRTERFSGITPVFGGNTIDFNYPGEGYGNIGLGGAGYNPGLPRFDDESTFIDFKASYNFTPWFQYYVEARNLGREAQTVSTGEYQPFGDGSPRIIKQSYSGVQFATGVVFRFGGGE